MGLKICLRPRFIPRNTSLVMKPRDYLLLYKIVTGQATTEDITAKVVEVVTHKNIKQQPTNQSVGIFMPITGQEGNTQMQTTPSWRGVVYSLLSILAVIVQLFVHSGMTPEQAATLIAASIVAGVLMVIDLVTHNKLKIASLAQTSTGQSIEQFVEDKLAEILKPVLAKVDTAGDKISAGSVPESKTTTPPAPVTLQAVQNTDGTYTIVKPDGAKVTV